MAPITEIISLTPSLGQCAELSTLQVAAGYVTWLNILKVFAIVIGATCFAFLFGKSVIRLVMLFKHIPVTAWEAPGYVIAAGLLMAGFLPDPTLASWMVPLGCILLAGLLPLSAKLHGIKPNETRYFFLMTVVTGVAAYYYGEPVTGFMTVMAFMALVGFSVVVTPLSYAIGFHDDEALNKAGGAALLITILLVLERVYAPQGIVQLDVYRTGMLWLGPFVFALALLISANRWYVESKNHSFLAMQLLAVVSYVAMITIGSLLHIDALLNVGTGFLILYVLEKPTEVRHENAVSLAITGLVLSLIVGGGVYWAQSHVDVVSAWIPAFAQH